eukprot:CAMPEP_0171341060 /NCGR_PEP_ID=MMETSP0878-20121228/8936_1 /TAXON_ID=67004 /ORGANISM="Thalassiosira weissflogii, Strain CCMP1336" /LENGTH=876 /DNA_ID=CAMNT_0011843187 /DNA_START=724 /DNA_END=3354 /DNA_ORIENTATION=-
MRSSSSVSSLALLAASAALTVELKSDFVLARKDPEPKAKAAKDNKTEFLDLLDVIDPIDLLRPEDKPPKGHKPTGNGDDSNDAMLLELRRKRSVNNVSGEGDANSNIPTSGKVKLLIKYKFSQSHSLRSINAINVSDVGNYFQNKIDLINQNLGSKRLRSNEESIAVVSNFAVPYASAGRLENGSSVVIASIEVSEEDKELILEEFNLDKDILFVEDDYPMYKFPFNDRKEGLASSEPPLEQMEHYINTQHRLLHQYNSQDRSLDNIFMDTHGRRLTEKQQYGLDLIQAPEVWTTIESTNRPISPVKVCIIDTGYDYTHEDLPKDNITTTETLYGSALEDGDGHGTHCAGVIGAIGGNDAGVVGVNPDPTKFSFHIAKALNSQGVGTASTVIEAVHGCISSGSKVISMSLGGGPSSKIAEEMFLDAYDQGVLVFAASGNKGEPNKDYPASYPHVVSVGAVDDKGKRAPWSNYNDQVELMGPGEQIESTYPGNKYFSLSGTSMATPYVAGVAALVWGYFPDCSNNQIRNVFASTASGTSDCDSKNGFGIVQAKAAFDMLDTYGCAAGGEKEVPLSSGAVGGCEQPLVNVSSLETSLDLIYMHASSNNNETCNQLEIEILTDTHAAEIEWLVERFVDESSTTVAKGPPEGVNYRSETLYTLTTDCLTPGDYEFTISDSYGDGIIEPGYYKVSMSNGWILATSSNFGTFESTRFTVGLPAEARFPDLVAKWAELIDENFSNGLGDFKGQQSVYLEEAFGRSGVGRVKDENQGGSSIYSSAFSLKHNYSTFKIVLSFYASDMEAGDKFCIDYSGDTGLTWNRAECLVGGSDFNNGFWEDGFSILFEDFKFSTSIQLRFRCKSKSSSGSIILDRVYLLGKL